MRRGRGPVPGGRARCRHAPEGVAEEAGFAAASPAERGIDGSGRPLAHLAGARGRAWTNPRPAVAAGCCTAAPGRALCPIAPGAAHRDHAALPEGPGADREIGGLDDHPIVLLPFLATIADDAGTEIRLA